MARFTLLSRRLLGAGIRPSPCIRAATRTFATATSSSSSASQQRPPSDYRIKLVEVGPRDGLQNEKLAIPLNVKFDLIERLAKAGMTTIEAGAFVSPKWVPQMEGSSEILEHLLQHPSSSPKPLTYAFLVPNQKGLESAYSVLSRHPDSFTPDPLPPTKDKPAIELAVFAAATESFSRANLNCDIDTSLVRFREVIQAAKEPSNNSPPLRVRAYISVVLGCPFEGHDVDPHQVARIATSLLEAGADEISLGDTTGMGTAPRTQELLRCLASAGVRAEDLAMHFHDTYGQALVNTAVALEHGIRTFDCSVGGLGGCPYSPGATGNVASEDMVYFMETLGMDTGVDLDALVDVGEWISQEIGRSYGSVVGRAVLGARQRAAKAAAQKGDPQS
ncbi:hypothetical protein VTJ04DRAFT_9349 [Mycothermus thermophilus]|uniref:uncharacterized protein n=1 Tax=Humicola insolens TaxID=85995 RepID=UPI003742DE77